MIHQINNGGPAFPRSGFEGETRWANPQSGMTLRDYFAAKAMQALVGLDHMLEANVAEQAYAQADAMLAARGDHSEDVRGMVKMYECGGCGGEHHVGTGACPTTGYPESSAPAVMAGQMKTDSDGWIEWNGYPLQPDTQVDLRLRDGRVVRGEYVRRCNWRHDGSTTDIIAYRVVQEGGAA